MLKALIFDFDGVIVDTESQWYCIYRDWLQHEYSYHLAIKDYLRCVGSDSSHLYSFLRKQIGEHLNIREFEKTARKEFINRTSQLPTMEGVVPFMVQAKKNKLKIAIATSATKEKPLYHLQRLHLLENIDVLSTFERSIHRKPAPDIFLKAVERLQCRAEECLAIEDSNNGLIAANRAYIPCLIVPNEITKYSDFKEYYKKVSTLRDVNINAIMQDFDK